MACTCKRGTCSTRAVLVILQIVLGLALTAGCTYVHLNLPIVRWREKPFWAGVPLLLAGLLGISFLGHAHNKHGCLATCAFFLKVSSIICASAAIFTCMTSLVFIALHMVQLFTYSFCRHLDSGCICFPALDTPEADGRVYQPSADGCFQVFCEMTICIGSMGGLCLLGGVVSLTYVFSLWRSLYGSTSSENAPREPHDVSTTAPSQFPPFPSSTSASALLQAPATSEG